MKILATSAAAVALAVLIPLAAMGQAIEFSDPKGDDKGPGNYEYPTDPVYKRGSFDLTKVTIEEKGSNIVVTVQVNSKIEDPWQSKKWDGNGFSVQYAVVHIDTDHKKGSGHQDALPGFNVKFAEDSQWEKALVISPQGSKRLKSEINSKAKSMKADIVVPKQVSVRGKKLVAKFPKSEVGSLSKSWGFQVLMQSNEGYPDKSDLLTRKVNEFNGQHRFGGGNDYNCDPHVMDILAGQAKGDGSEKDAQYAQLKTYQCDDENPEGGKQATVGMIYPGE